MALTSAEVELSTTGMGPLVARTVATERVLSVLRANSIFDVLNPEYVERRRMRLDEPFEICDRNGDGTGIVVEAFAVPGKVALYLEDAAAAPTSAPDRRTPWACASRRATTGRSASTCRAARR